jgi:hypothetical protein
MTHMTSPTRVSSTGMEAWARTNRVDVQSSLSNQH